MANIIAYSSTVTNVEQNTISINYTSDKKLTDIKLSMDNGLTYKNKISMTSNSALFDITGVSNGEYKCNLKGYYDEGIVKIHFLSQEPILGDCMLIQCDNGKNILIDSNYDATTTKNIEYIKSLGISSLDYIICTHHHTDHTEGMPSILNAFDTTNAIAYHKTPDWSRLPTIEVEYKSKESHDAFVNTCNTKGIRIVTPTEKQRITVSENTYFEFYNVDNDNYTDYNYLSLVVLLVHGDKKYLFGADIPAGAQEELIKHNLECDVYKINHHDVDIVISEGFYNKMKAKAMIITNPIKHSNGRPLGASGYCQLNNIPYYSQHDFGTITITSTGDKFTVACPYNTLYKNAWWDRQGTKKWYYFKSDGSLAKNESIEIDGKVYNFDLTGLCTNPY